jgi:hypothetical protein
LIYIVISADSDDVLNGSCFFSGNWSSNFDVGDVELEQDGDECLEFFGSEVSVSSGSEGEGVDNAQVGVFHTRVVDASKSGSAIAVSFVIASGIGKWTVARVTCLDGDVTSFASKSGSAGAEVGDFGSGRLDAVGVDESSVSAVDVSLTCGSAAVDSSKSVRWTHALRLAVDDCASLVVLTNNRITSSLIDWSAFESNVCVSRRDCSVAFNASASSVDAPRVGDGSANDVGALGVWNFASWRSSAISADAESFSGGSCYAIGGDVVD